MRRDIARIAAVLIAAVAAVIAVFAYRGERMPPAAPAPPVAGPATPAASKTASAVAPSFDAVHVGSDGQAVIAGRAAPGAEVTILDGDRPIGKATADANGEWVATPKEPLPPGTHELSLSAAGKEETEPVRSPATVAVLVPERPATPAGEGQGAVAVLLPGGGERARPIQLSARPAPHQLALDMLEYDAAGRTFLTGRSDAGARIEIFVDGHDLGGTVADAKGDWSVELDQGVPMGPYRLRLEGKDADGSDAGRLALELRRAFPGERMAGEYVAVLPGNNLWRLARRTYGAGGKYVEIFQANRQKIYDPNLIFPGQLLALPGKS